MTLPVPDAGIFISSVLHDLPVLGQAAHLTRPASNEGYWAHSTPEKRKKVDHLQPKLLSIP